MAYDSLFSNIEKHVALSDQDKRFIKNVFIQRKVKKGQFLVHAGAVERNQIFIVSGTLITYFTDLDGHEHIIQFGIEGWWIGDLQSYVFQQPASCNVEALEDSQVLEASYDDMQRLYEAVPQYERYHRIITQHGYVAFQQRVLQNLSMTAEDRYLSFVKKYPKIELRLPQKIIASYLGMTPEFLSKIKKKINSKDKSN